MLLPSSSLPKSELFSFDKLIHFGVFALLSGLVSFGAATTGAFGKSTTIQVVISLTISIVYSTVLELLQQFIPGRAADLYDILANVAGAVFGVTVFYTFIKNKLAIEKLM